MKAFRIIIVVPVFMWGALIFGQAATSDSTLFRFQQQNSTYRWSNIFQYSGRISQLSYDVSNSFISTMTEVQSAQKQWKDDQQFRGRLYGPMPGKWLWELQGNLQWYNDEQSGYFNDSRIGAAALGIRREARALNFGVSSGYKQDIRRQFVDTGPTLAGELSLNRANWAGYKTSGMLQLRGENLDTRQNRTYVTRWLVSKEFAPGVSDHLSVNVSQRKRSYYLASGIVEERSETRQHLENQLRYRVFDPFSVRLSTEYSRDQTAIETPFVGSAAVQQKDRANYNLRNSLGMFLDTGPFRNEMYIRYEVQQNLYRTDVRDTVVAPSQLRRQTPPNDNSNTLQLEGKSHLGIGYQDSLQFTALAMRMQYNTPDSTNYDDRDEVRYRYGLEYIHLFAPGFRWRTGGEVLLSHYAYLYSQRSAENYWNRVYRLFSGVHWKRHRWEWHTSAEVLANYYDYEYDDLLQQVRSIAFRHMVYRQQIYHPLGQRWQGQFRFDLQLEDQGRLDWTAFVEELILEREIGEIEYKILVPIGQTLSGNLGYRYQRRIDWRIKEGKKFTAERIYTQGPVFQVRYRSHKLPVIVWEGTLMDVTQVDVQQSNTTKYPISHLRLQAFWRW